MDAEKRAEVMNNNMQEKGVEKKREVGVDDAITMVGEYGRFQIIVNAIICVMALPPVFQIMIMYFAADKSRWRCKEGSTRCTIKGKTFPYEHMKDPTGPNKCNASFVFNEDWEFVQHRKYSLVTTYDLQCHNEIIIEMVTSAFFVGWIIGAVVLGWFSDNYGRKPVLFVSMAVIMVTGLVSPFIPNVYVVILCRLIIGTFVPGTYQQGIMIITESVGPRYRAFAGNIVFVFVTSSMALVGLKAYFIRDWKILHIVCTVPYIIMLLFYKFVPESLRFLAVKGRTKELMSTLHRMAKVNNTDLPSDIVVVSDSFNEDVKTNPLDLFKSPKLCRMTLYQILGYIVGGVTFYGLYLAAKDIGGSLHRDYEIVTLVEIPFALSAIPLCDNFGRKKTVIGFWVVGTLACIGLLIIPDHQDVRIYRVLLGMLGKCSVGGGYNSLQTWTVELYPTYIRGVGVGFLQVLTRAGAACAPIVDTELAHLNPRAPFIFFGAITFGAMAFLPFLKETCGVQLVEQENQVTTESEDHAVEFKGVGNEFSVHIYENNESTANLYEHEQQTPKRQMSEPQGVTNELYNVLEDNTEESE